MLRRGDAAGEEGGPPRRGLRWVLPGPPQSAERALQRHSGQSGSLLWPPVPSLSPKRRGNNLHLKRAKGKNERDRQANFLFRSPGTAWVLGSAASLAHPKPPTRGTFLPSPTPHGGREPRPPCPPAASDPRTLNHARASTRLPPDVTLSPSPLREPRRIVPGVPGDCVLNPVPLLSLRLQPLPSHLESTHPRSSPPPQTLRAWGKVSGLPEKVFSPASKERPGWLSPPRGAQLPFLPPLPALRGPVQPQVLSGASPQSRWRRSSRTQAGVKNLMQLFSGLTGLHNFTLWLSRKYFTNGLVHTSHLGFETTVTFAEKKMSFYVKTEKTIRVYFEHCDLMKRLLVRMCPKGVS
ncbi:proline-rich protein 36 [Bos taurus]|uniref:proline-rich protein 36 n=1 Tax=Bos taurus TaxID=9913 RepID=UPI000D53A7F0|nr:proline-rich protein 36 [Bos taurus]